MPEIKRASGPAGDGNAPDQGRAPDPKVPRVEYEGRQLDQAAPRELQLPSDRELERESSMGSLMETRPAVLSPGAGVAYAPRLKNFGNTCFINASLHWLYRALDGEIPDKLWQMAVTPGLTRNMAVSLINLLKHMDRCRSAGASTANQSRESSRLLKDFIHSCQDYALNFQDKDLPLQCPLPEGLSVSHGDGYGERERSGYQEQIGTLVVVPDNRQGTRSVRLDQQDAHEFITALVHCLQLEGVPGYQTVCRKTLTTHAGRACFRRYGEPHKASFLILPLEGRSVDESFRQLNRPRSEQCVWDSDAAVQTSSGDRHGGLRSGTWSTVVSENLWLDPQSKGLMVQLGAFRLGESDIQDATIFNRKQAIALLENSLDGLVVATDEDGEQPCTLKLTGLICHKGENLLSGHYVAVERQGDTWYLLDDQSRRVNGYSSLTGIFAAGFAPYLLLYQKAEDGFQPAPVRTQPLPSGSEDESWQGDDRGFSPEPGPDDPMTTTSPVTEPDYGDIPVDIAGLTANEHYRAFLQGYATCTKPGYSNRVNVSTEDGVVARLPIPEIPWLRNDIKCWDDRLAGFLCQLCGIEYEFKHRYTEAHHLSNALLFIDSASDEYITMLGRYASKIWEHKPGLTRLCKALRLDGVRIPEHRVFSGEIQNTGQWDTSDVYQLLELVAPGLAAAYRNEPFPLFTELVDAIDSSKDPEALLLRLNKGLKKGIPGMEPPQEKGFRISPYRWSMAKLLYVINKHREAIEERLEEPLPEQWKLRDHDFLTLMSADHPEYPERFKAWFVRRVLRSGRLHDLMQVCNACLYQFPQVEGFPKAGQTPSWDTRLLYDVADYFNLPLPGEPGNYQDFVREHRKQSTRIDNIIKQLNIRAGLDSQMEPPQFRGVRRAEEWSAALLKVMLQIDTEFSEQEKRQLPKPYQAVHSDYLKVCEISSDYYADNIKAIIEWVTCGTKIPPTLRSMTFSRLLYFLNEPRGKFKPEILPVPDHPQIDACYRGQFPWPPEALEQFLERFSVSQAPKRMGSPAEEMCHEKIYSGSTVNVLVVAMNRASCEYPEILKPYLVPEVWEQKNQWVQSIARILIAVRLANTPQDQTNLKDKGYRLRLSDLNNYCPPEKVAELQTLATID